MSVVLLSNVQAGTRGRVLLTGANGFTGMYVRAELASAGYQVVGAVMSKPRDHHEVALDITSLDQCHAVIEAVRPDFLIHLAGISFVQHVDASAFYRVNVMGTTNLLQAMGDVGLSPRRVVLASSANIYGSVASGVVSEMQAPQPVNHYATSKVAMEYMARTWADRFPIAITRPFNYTGVGQGTQFLVPKIVSAFVDHDEVIELGNLDVERDFSDVRDVARVYRRLLECDCANETVNICSGQSYSLRQIVHFMEEMAGYQIDVRVNPAFVRKSEVRLLVGSPLKLRAMTGLSETILFERTLQWMFQTWRR